MDRTMLDTFHRLHGQLEAAKAEIDGLAGKGDDAPAQQVGAVKLPLLDQLLTAADAFLEADRPFTFAGFGNGDEGGATLSDASWVLAQYLACFESWRARHVEKRHERWVWLIESVDEQGAPRTERVPVERYSEKTD